MQVEGPICLGKSKLSLTRCPAIKNAGTNYKLHCREATHFCNNKKKDK